ncbi:hypothetical protein SAMN05216228_10329 [Rhizobium tibeticum]|uniref:Tetracyclin repressor-like C-terminal domain-containing protein n=1 Tax=Rhizobium tibeticum TaxID=501024 RepID=A0A1H8U5F1_9HYPH|nr:hypothetical protein RTCCBAU85039_5437 [Rhizobium tibeticum]SEO98286.1 hypothetical protein SAMN05216228_10329 [Rhizobium tibeticum]
MFIVSERGRPDRDVQICVGYTGSGHGSTVGKEFSETPRRPAEIEAYVDAMADMFCAYIRNMVDRGTS